MTFETWWKEIGSFHNDIFSFCFEAREVYKRVAQTAWDSSESLTNTEMAEYEEKIESLEVEVARLNEELGDARKQRNASLNDIKTLKASILACL